MRIEEISHRLDIKRLVYCPMCRRDLPKSGRGYIVGRPTSFIICRDCWKGFVIRNVDNLNEVLQGTIRFGKM